MIPIEPKLSSHSQIPKDIIEVLDISPNIEITACKAIIIEGIELRCGLYYALSQTDKCADFFRIKNIFIIGEKYHIFGENYQNCLFDKKFRTYTVGKPQSRIIELKTKLLISGRGFQTYSFENRIVILRNIRLTKHFKVFSLFET